MKYVEFEESIFIPASKICGVIKEDNLLIIWLDGSQTETLSFANKEDRDSYYKTITNILKEL